MKSIKSRYLPTGHQIRWTAGWTGNKRKKLVIATTCREEILACQIGRNIPLHTGEVVGSIPTVQKPGLTKAVRALVDEYL